MPFQLNDNASSITYSLLNELRVPVTKGFLRKELQSHPYYPSLLAVSDILKFYNVQNEALKITENNFDSYSPPFIAHLTVDNGIFCLIEKVTNESVLLKMNGTKKELLTRENFFKIWDGIVLIANASNRSTEPNYSKNAKLEKFRKVRLPVFISLISAIIIMSFIFTDRSLSVLPLLITKAIGLFFINLLIKHELGEDSNITNKLCTMAKNIGCNEVLNSKASKIFKDIKMADIGLVWFLTSIFFLIQYNKAEMQIANINILSWFSIFSIPFIIFSISYQAFVIRKYCPLCLGVMSVLIIDCILFITFYNSNFTFPDFASTLTMLTILITTTFCWVVIKPFLLNQEYLVSFEIKYLNLKRHLNVFNSLAFESQEYDIEALHDAIKITNNVSQITITEIINPYCAPCEQAFRETIKTIANSNEHTTNFQFAFLVPTDNCENIITKTTLHFIALYNNSTSKEITKALSDWFEIKDYKKWSNKYPCIITDLHFEMLKKQVQWSKNNQISGTPTTIINNRKLPLLYNIEDLKYIFK